VWLLLFQLSPLFLFSQTDKVVVQRILIEGNTRTKDKIILRELDFSIGDTLSLDKLGEQLAANQLLLMNTGLFTQARINIKTWELASNKLDLIIAVEENWYIYPFPVFELADRNFNEWWKTHHRSLKRVNFGLRFYHMNFSGRRDLLKLAAQYGFTQKYELTYTLPFINGTQTFGLSTNLLYTRNKEIGFNTIGDKLQYRRDQDHVLRKRFRAGIGLSYRPQLETYHRVRFQYHQIRINESVNSELNSDYLLQRLQQQYLSFSYELTVDKRDIKPYPLKGNLFSVSLRKDGFGLFDDLNALTLTATFKQYFSIDKKWSVEWVGKGQSGLIREKQPYFNSRALGYDEDFIRGFEFYVIDGLDYAYMKTSLHFELFNFAFDLGKSMPLKPFKLMPVKWYLSLNNDLGFVNNPFYRQHNSLGNQLLWGGGIGLDIVAYYDKVFRMEYSFNSLGESGFFLHWALSF